MTTQKHLSERRARARTQVWPAFLCYDYSLDAVPLVRTMSDFRLMLPLAAYTGCAQLLAVALWPLLRRRKAGRALEGPIVGVAILTLGVVPMANIVFPVGTVIGEPRAACRSQRRWCRRHGFMCLCCLQVDMS